MKRSRNRPRASSLPPPSRARHLASLAVTSLVLGGVTSMAFFVAACSDDAEDVLGAPDSGSEPVVDASAPSTTDDDAAVDAGARDVGPEVDAAPESVVCVNEPCVVQLVAGYEHFCALLADGTVRCWGSDAVGNLGRGTRPDAEAAASPARVVDLSGVTQLSAAGRTTCARTTEGRLRCWGSNDYGQLGLQADPVATDWMAHRTPADVALATTAVRVDVTPSTACATDTDGSVTCWGQNSNFQLARGEATEAEGPAPADMRGFDVEHVVGGLESIDPNAYPPTLSLFGLTGDRELVGWGAVSGRPSSLRSTAIPTPLPVRNVTSVAAGPTHACAVTDGAIQCWGTNAKGALGTGLPAPAPPAVAMPTLAPLAARGVLDPPIAPQQIAVAASTSCVRMTDGTLQCCGDDRLGQLGRGTPGQLASLFGRATAFVEHAVHVEVSNLATCALVQGGTVACWGGNTNGELGQGTHDTDPHPSPVQVVLQ